MVKLGRRLPRVIRIGSLALIVLAATLGWKWWSARSTSDLIARSREAYQTGKIGRALSLAQEALERRPDDVQAKEMRDKVLARLARSGGPVASPAQTKKSAARTELAAGQTDRALADLQSLLAQGPDREASWLVSRAFLQRRDIAAARSALQQASGFGSNDPTTPEPAPFVGANQCQSCHAAKYRTQRASGHGQSLRWGGELAAIPFPDRTFKDPDSDRVSYAFHRDGQGVSVETQIDGKAHEATLKYAVGSGSHGLSVVGVDDLKHARLARVSLFVHTTMMNLTPSVPRGLADDSQYLGRPLDSSTLTACLGCHTTTLTKTAIPGETIPFERGIGCERCHGAGDHHIKAVEGNLEDLAIARLRRASPRQILNLCGQCHMPPPGEPLPPDDPALVRQQARTMPLSRCFTASGEQLSCVSCHNPHENAETSPAFYEEKCLACHSASVSASTPVKTAAGSRRFRTVVCPVNATKNCIGCHMPKVEIPDEHASYADHYIRVHREAGHAEGG